MTADSFITSESEIISNLVTAENETVESSTDIIPSDSVNLNEESLMLLSQIISESDERKAEDLTHLFNVNQNKKTMVRVNKLSDLLDTITDQALTRFTKRPDEISNKELFDGLKIVQDLIERGQRQVSNVTEKPLIQVNQQTNEINVGDTTSSLSRDSRERVKSAVLGLLESIATTTQNTTTESFEDTLNITTVEEDDTDNDE